MNTLPETPSILTQAATKLLYLTAANQFFQATIFPLASTAYKFYFRGRDYLKSYIHYDVPERQGSHITNEYFSDVQLYLSDIVANSPITSRLNLFRTHHSPGFTYGLAPEIPIVDTFNGATVTWQLCVSKDKGPHESGKFSLRFHKDERDLIVPGYLNHIRHEAEAIRNRSREQKLYSNKRGPWVPVPFKHPSTFDTIAMDPAKKEEIINDLREFADNGSAFYQKTGRAWKRGYLLYGPPGTGKSSMIAAMANYLKYDIYDLELTKIQNNSDLRNRLTETTSKSIIVIEDIDCSVDLGKRSKKRKHGVDTGSITLSGLLNCTDGLWSCYGSERIFLFTTNHVENIDPALLRSGRMDMHIHMGYCSFLALKELMKNYLGFEEDDYKANSCIGMLDEVKGLVDEAEISPADVSEFFIKRRRLEVPQVVPELVEELKDRIKRKAEGGEEKSNVEEHEETNPSTSDGSEDEEIKPSSSDGSEDEESDDSSSESFGDEEDDDAEENE